jgi:hypothetical protein
MVETFACSAREIGSVAAFDAGSAARVVHAQRLTTQPIASAFERCKLGIARL